MFQINVGTIQQLHMPLFQKCRGITSPYPFMIVEMLITAIEGHDIASTVTVVGLFHVTSISLSSGSNTVIQLSPGVNDHIKKS